MVRRFTGREKYVVYGGAGLMGLFLLHLLVISPLIGAHDARSRSLQAKTIIRDDIIRMKSEYQAIQRRASASTQRFAGRKANFTLFSFLDSLAGDAEIKEHITYMKPSTSTPKDSPYKISLVEMKLQNITMAQLTTYLHKVETSKNMVFVKRLSVSKEGKQDGSINAVLQVETSET
jgi:general secretion pathway protein M